jgi:hypothetical protein
VAVSFVSDVATGRRTGVPSTSWGLMVWRGAVEAHPRARTITVRSVCWALVTVDFVDGVGLAYGGERVAATSTYDVLRLIPGGMKSYGVLLLLGAVMLAWAIGQASHAADSRLAARWLQFVLSFGVGYYLFWSVCIPLAWWHSHDLPEAWPALSKYILLAALYFACARAVAPARRWRGRART